MAFLQWVNTKISKMTYWDIGILKLCLVAFTLMIASLFPRLTQVSWPWYGAVFFVSYLYLMYKLFIKN